MTMGLFGDFEAERQRIRDTAAEALFSGILAKSDEPDVTKVGPKGYVHGWIKETPGAGNGAKIPVEDRANVQAHAAEDRSTAIRTEMTKPGSHEHANELRQLASEADLHQARNYASLRSGKPGPASAEQTALGAGSNREDLPESDASRVLRRAATMIDRNQPSLARAHSDAIREAAATEAYKDPMFASRLNAAADKLDTLPKGQGLAAQPPETSAFQENTAAAGTYAKKSKKKKKK
jgi:hypothetical protein